MNSDLSALMDGELDPEETARVLRSLRQDAALRETWAAYHLVGDALRCNGPLGFDVTAAVARRLADEPTILAPAGRHAPTPRPVPLLAVAASVAAFAFVGLLAWQMTRIQPEANAPVQVAQGQGARGSAGAAVRPTPVAVAAAESRPVAKAATRAAEPPRVHFPAVVGDAYLLAHQEFSPSYAMVGMPAYVRAVSEADGGQ